MHERARFVTTVLISSLVAFGLWALSESALMFLFLPFRMSCAFEAGLGLNYVNLFAQNLSYIMYIWT